MDSRVLFERNLAAIRKRHATLASALEACSSEGIEEIVGPRGAKVLRERGVLLGSAYDPDREAARMAAQMGASPADVMVAVGFGLGRQFEPYCAEHPGTLIIFEPSLPRLRAALEQISIVNLFATQRDLYLATDIDELTRLIDARYVPALRMRAFPHPAVVRLDPDAVAAAVERVRQAKEANDTRTLTGIEQLMPWAWVVAQNGRRIAESPSLGRAEADYLGKPCVIAAAGPSLDKQLPILREMRDRVLVIAIGQTVRALRGAGIEPDIVHVLESQNVSHQLSDSGETDSLCVALSADAHPALYDLPTRARFMVPTGGSPMASWMLESMGETAVTLGGGTVAQGAVGVALMLGANPIILIGQDLAFTDGRAYAKGSAYEFIEFDMGDDGSCNFKNMKKKVGMIGDRDLDTVSDRSTKGQVVWVEGWEEGTRVPTWQAYSSFLEQYRQIGEFLALSDIELINCTEGGARIRGIAHRPFREVLEEVTDAPFDAYAGLVETFDDSPRFGLEDFRKGLVRARRDLDQVEEAAGKARRFAQKARPRLLAAKSDQQRVEVLRGLARHEKRIRRHLERMPWLDALVQPEIYNAIAAVRRTERLDPSDEDLADESAYLFEAARNGVWRARQWFDAFEASFDSDDAVERVRAEHEELARQRTAKDRKRAERMRDQTRSAGTRRQAVDRNRKDSPSPSIA